MEALAAFEPAMRRAIVAELSAHRTRPGVAHLLRLLGASSDPVTRAAARGARNGAAPTPSAAGGDPPAESPEPDVEEPVRPLADARAPAVIRPPEVGARVPGQPSLRWARSVVTPVEGRGRGALVISISRAGQRRTAAFCCDVLHGILDVVGEVEPESGAAGRLVDEFRHQAGADQTCDAPALALGLLGGSLMLCGPIVPAPVRDWLDGTLGPDFRPAGLPAVIPGWDPKTVPDDEMPGRAHQVLEACPSWLDRSALTFDLAEEIHLREGPSAADPDRDAGAYRYLFEHRLVHRLERYRRMLLWMAWLWQCAGRTGLARSAFALAGQLSDEQYAVPSHPFTMALTTRSLEAARDRLRSAEDPRRGG
jgi:hypothetical protein